MSVIERIMLVLVFPSLLCDLYTEILELCLKAVLEKYLRACTQARCSIDSYFLGTHREVW